MGIQSFRPSVSCCSVVKMIKKQLVVALVLLLLIPLVLVLGGALFSLINPEIAAGHPNYVRNFHLLNLLKKTTMWATAAGVAVLWLLVCLQVIRAKKRSPSWLDPLQEAIPLLADSGGIGAFRARCPGDAERSGH